VFIDLVKALGRIKYWEYLRIENIQYYIKRDTQAGLTQILPEVLGKVTKNISNYRGLRQSLYLSLTVINIYIDIMRYW
jgi:hypothetical protein